MNNFYRYALKALNLQGLFIVLANTRSKTLTITMMITITILITITIATAITLAILTTIKETVTRFCACAAT